MPLGQPLPRKQDQPWASQFIYTKTFFQYTHRGSRYLSEPRNALAYPSLIKIRCFVAVAEALAFGKAAAGLNLSQPALSGHVRDLEEMLGAALFHRTTRRVELTQEGANFLPRARRVLEEIEAGIDELRDRVSLQKGRLVVACVPSVGTLVLPRVLGSFSRRYPNIDVQIIDGAADLVFRKVMDRKADFGVGPLPDGSWDEIDSAYTLNDRFLALLPEDHVLSSESHVTLRDLAGFPFVSLPPQTNVRMVLDREFARIGRPLVPAHEFSQYYTLGAFVSAGFGVSALPSMAARMAAHDGVMLKPISAPPIIRDVGVYVRRDNAHSPAMKHIFQSLSQQWRSIQGDAVP